jgi:transketolase
MAEMKATRDAFGEELLELGRKNKKIVALADDLEDSTRAIYFKKEFPERFFNLGIAEQDELGVAVGLAQMGLIPFATGFGVFLTDRAYGILRISICYNGSNVKLVGSHTGLTVGQDGATAQCLEDYAVLRVLPNLTVLSPCDYYETKKATREMARICGPVYMRTGRVPYPVITKESDPFEIGRANVLREGRDLAIIACGLMVSESLLAAQELAKENIDAAVVNMHTIKPIDRETIIKFAANTGAVVTAEEHQINGGLGSAVSEVLATSRPACLEMVAVRDTFGESGDPEGLLKKYHLKSADIVVAAKRALKRKGSA